MTAVVGRSPPLQMANPIRVAKTKLSTLTLLAPTWHPLDRTATRPRILSEPRDDAVHSPDRHGAIPQEPNVTPQTPVRKKSGKGKQDAICTFPLGASTGQSTQRAWMCPGESVGGKVAVLSSSLRA